MSKPRPRRQKRASARPQPLEEYTRHALALANEFFTAPPPWERPIVERPSAAPPAAPQILGPPRPGDTARLVAAWLRLRHVEQEERPTRDRCLVEAERIREMAQRGEVSDDELRIALGEIRASGVASDARIAAAREQFEHARRDVYAGRLLSGKNPDLERVLRRVFPEWPQRVVPWGYRPGPGERLKPAPPPPSKHEPSFAERAFELIMARQ